MYKLEVVSVQTPNILKKIHSMVIEQTKGILYCSDDINRRIVAYSLNTLCVVGQVKTMNGYVTQMLVDTKLERMYAASREGHLIFFDVSQPDPVPQFTLRVCKTPGDSANYIR